MEERDFPRRYLTIGEIWEMYRRQDKPLPAEAIPVILSPFSSTSYMKRANAMLRDVLPSRLPTALDLYGAFHGLELSWYDEPLQEQAQQVVTSLTGWPVQTNDVYGMRWMEPDEVIVREFRRDYLYYDSEQLIFAGSHRAAQYWVYKAGTLQGILPFSMIDYERERQGVIDITHYSHLAEGILDHAFFTDRERQALLFLDPRHQRYRKATTLIYISPNFSYEAAGGQ